MTQYILKGLDLGPMTNKTLIDLDSLSIPGWGLSSFLASF